MAAAGSGAVGHAGEASVAGNGTANPTAAGGGTSATAGAAGTAGRAVSGAAGTAGAAGASPGSASGVIVDPTDDATYIFDQTQLRTYNILVATSDLNRINQSPPDELWVPAQLEFEGKTYGPYKFRFKGSQGSFKWPCTTMNDGTGPRVGKCSMKLGFDEVNKDTRFYGLRKLNFHSMNTDPTYMRDRLGYSLFHDHGIATARAAHARVLINGKLEGLFSVVEQLDGRFTRARFADGGEGNLYKEAWPLSTDPNDYLSTLETNEDQQPSVQVMLSFQAAIAKGGSAALEPFLDRAYMARYMAVDRVIMNDDGMFHFYCTPGSDGSGNHNYYWYQAITGQRLWPIPWDLDHSFDNSPWIHIEPAWSTTASCSCTQYMDYGYQVPSACDPFVKQLIKWRADYDAQVDEFLKGPFSSKQISAKLNGWRTQIQAAVVEAADGTSHAPSESEWADALDELQAKIDSARQHRGFAY